jgi:hypothetical protein
MPSQRKLFKKTTTDVMIAILLLKAEKRIITNWCFLKNFHYSK